MQDMDDARRYKSPQDRLVWDSAKHAPDLGHGRLNNMYAQQGTDTSRFLPTLRLTQVGQTLTALRYTFDRLWL